MKMPKLVFTAPSFMHPNGDKTVYEVATDLEKRYKLLDSFVEYDKKKIGNILSKQAVQLLKGKKTVKQMQDGINNSIKTLWRSYIRDEKHGIITRIAVEEDRQAFIDTGTYFLSIEPQIMIEE